RLVALGSADPALQVVAALELAAHSRLGEDAGVIAGCGTLGVALAGELREPVDAAIDFSVPAAVGNIVAICREQKIPLVIATTGLEDAHRAQIRDAAKLIPLLCAPSMSLASNLVMKLAEITGKALRDHPSGADVEIIERHHRYKEDAPSGTALAMGQIIADAMGLDSHRHGREGRPGARPHNEIGYHAVRTGDNPGEHTIIFGLLGESIELSVRATSRDSYAYGALAAAKFLAKQKPGLYSIRDVLGL
ncbi:MAG: 4-hydroxy-tetrahydrodipicolinate reductase, partial [Pirellulales bacterium]